MGRTIPAAALILGLAGAIPFVALAITFALGLPELLGFPALGSLIAYSAVILSFLGGIRWGAALQADPAIQPIQFILAVIPSLIGWIALLMPQNTAPSILLLAMMAQGISDVAGAQQRRLPPWFGRLRLLLTVIVSLSLLVVIAAIYWRST
jgi:hypothetical protein